MKTKGKAIDQFIGKHCKIVTSEPGEEKVHVVTGKIIDVEPDVGFVMVESDQGLGVLNIKSIVAIKPKAK